MTMHSVKPGPAMAKRCGCVKGGSLPPVFCREHDPAFLEPRDKSENYSPHTVVSDHTSEPARKGVCACVLGLYVCPEHRPQVASPVQLELPLEHIDYSEFAIPLDHPAVGETFGPLGPREHLLPTDYEGRKAIPVCTGVLDYFPAALIEVAKVSHAGNEQHNPGQKLHWARGKSMNQADTMLRHWMERGAIDTDGVRHTAKAAWRALAELQLELERAGAPVARGAK